ncbi:uncharacterized protein EKO05_0009226 [Ascochyta rabiei]|uniref:uncharacterized protein n=1 Tax=Didymella rabiei TaxID=5454 RepID=UPI002208A2AF|nr:uncharacterized protein EKO05_0009226 [Ascochyta rabiei]UPX18946.1 hypothetical protein EKO05_0009226 [Ascochyta rabiei]
MFYRCASRRQGLLFCASNIPLTQGVEDWCSPASWLEFRRCMIIDQVPPGTARYICDGSTKASITTSAEASLVRAITVVLIRCCWRGLIIRSQKYERKPSDTPAASYRLYSCTTIMPSIHVNRVSMTICNAIGMFLKSLWNTYGASQAPVSSTMGLLRRQHRQNTIRTTNNVTAPEAPRLRSLLRTHQIGIILPTPMTLTTLATLTLRTPCCTSRLQPTMWQ